MNGSERAITVANDTTLSKLILSAAHRVVVMAPAISKAVAKAIADRWCSLGADAVTVIVDVNPEVYRLGFGDFEALELLEKTAADLGTTLNRHDGIRIGLLIVDDTTVVYSPTPQLIEAGPKTPTTPNAIVIGHPPETIARELGQGPNGRRKQTVGRDKAEKAKITDVKLDLDRNPPQKFDIARQVHVFNAAFEFVDFELLGTSIDRKTVRIPKHLSGIADEKTRDQLRQSFTILPPNHELSGTHLEHDKKLIAKKYLRSIKSYGNVVLRSRKTDFENDVKSLKAAVTKFSEEIREQLQQAMDENREILFESMLPLVERAIPKEWLTSDRREPDAAMLHQLLDDDLRRAFGKADRLIKHMEVRCVFKGVTYELLTDAKFMEAAKEAIPELNKLYEMFDAAKVVDGDGKEDS